MATIDTENLAKGLQQVEACWQAYTSSQRLIEGLEGCDLSSAIETANRDFTRFQNQCQLFFMPKCARGPRMRTSWRATWHGIPITFSDA